MKMNHTFSVTLVLLAALVYCGLTGAVAQENEGPVVQNGGFETDGGWEVITAGGGEGTAEVDETVALSGSRSMRMTKTNGVGWVILRSAEPLTLAPALPHGKCHGRQPAASARFGQRPGTGL